MMRHERQYGAIARRLIRTLPEFAQIADSDVRIAYLSSDKEKKVNHRIILGECCKVDEKYSWCCPYDFFIVVYEPNVVDLNDHQIEVLIRHELHHVGIEYGNGGERYYIAPHDLEEFWRIIEDEGLHWSDSNAERTASEQQESA